MCCGVHKTSPVDTDMPALSELLIFVLVKQGRKAQTYFCFFFSRNPCLPHGKISSEIAFMLFPT